MTAPGITRAGVDPRIRARRIEVQRQLGRRRLRVLVVAAAVAALGGGAWWAVRSPLLDVDRVVVRGAVHVDAATIVGAAGVARGQALLDVDTGAVVRRVESLAWVARADVARDWPGTLRITVREYRPVAFARRPDGAVALLSAGGRVLADADAAGDGLVEVTGLRRVPDVGSRLFPPDAAGVARAVPRPLGRQVVAVDVADGVALRLASGTEVRLGTLDDLAAKAAAALAVLERAGGAAYVDVRVPSAPVAAGGGAPTDR